MRFDIRDLAAAPGRRFPVDVSVTPPAELLGDTDWTITNIRIQGEAFLQLSTVYMEVSVQATIIQPCRRCLTPVPVSVDVSEPFELPVRPDADWVDPLPFVLQMIETVHNPRILCSESCRGLCPSCGADLNEDPDHICRTDESDRRTLRDFLA
jgi:uncharacterized metal-binding protein YceD (DUF177 family)